MPDRNLQQRCAAANTLLIPQAVPYEGVLGRAIAEPEDETRYPFQRDRDRIIHTQAFRRLQGKTQVFTTGEGDHYRTRLTHTMEVAQISRDIARTIGVNEDLAECIALAHDLGHPPFGHTGEEGINEWMQQFGKHFEHNLQSHRIVTELEHHSLLYTGLNLQKEVLDGLLKHQTVHDQAGATFTGQTLEAQLVNIADEIAYSAHDSDDGLQAGLFSLEDILTVPLAKEAHEKTKERGTSLRGAIIHMLVTDLYSTFSTGSLMAFSHDMTKQLSMLRTFLWEHMYMHEAVLRKSTEGKTMLQTVLQHLYEQPNEKIQSEMQQKNIALEDATKDYAAGMTERFALQIAGTF